MWPNLMGPGWQQPFVLAVGILGAIIVAMKALASAADRLEVEEAPDSVLRLWHRYEEGDLTRQEFERARRSLREPTARAQADRSSCTEVHRVAAS